MTTPTLTFFMLVRTTPAWLTLTPPERFAWLGKTVEPLLAAHPGVALRYFDAEAFTGQFSDVLMWETSDLSAYQSLVEGLRETAFWGTYFDVREIIPAIENAYATHYRVKPMGASQS